MNHEETAVEYFGNNFNCSQAVFATFAEELGMDVETALKSAHLLVAEHAGVKSAVPSPVH